MAMSEIQEQIQRHIDTLGDTGAETGVQVAVYQGGALIVDAVAGTADPATGRPVTSGTPIFSFSTGKNVAATLAHLLVARGFLDYDSPVTDLWPEFGVHGKATATLRHVLTHTVGLPAMPREITPLELPDWSRVCESLAAAEPRLADLSALAFEGTDQVFGTPARMALGFPIGRMGAPAEENSVAFGWPGGGGSYAYADPARGVAFALTKTRLVPNFDTVLSVTRILADYLAGAR
jgi:CubicO group peptidase (beta-lactamase class C family)